MDNNNMNNKKQIYFNDLTIKDMFKNHDWTYMYSDDGRAYNSGRKKQEIINDKIQELGGWTQELVDSHNKFAPQPMAISEDWFENYKLKE